MNLLDEFHQIEDSVNYGLIDPVDAVAKVKDLTGKRSWDTKYWKDLRIEKLKENCSQCGSSDAPLVIQHFWHPRTYQEILYSEFQGKGREIYPVNYLRDVEIRSGCPKCRHINIRFRKRVGNWICSYCKFTFSDPTSVEISYLDCSEEGSRINKNIFREAYQKYCNDEEAKKSAFFIYLTDCRNYINLEGTTTFCKKCAFLWDIKGMELCSRCKVHYHRFGYLTCFVCSKELEKRENAQR